MKFVIISAILILIIAGVLYYFVLTGIISVVCQRPVEALVQIDGVQAGYTPLQKRIRTGIHHVKVFKEGFEQWEGEVKVNSMSPATVNIKLKFLLQSEPTGAKVRINNVEVGMTDMFIDLAPGIYTFELVKPGYRKAKFIAKIPQNVNQPLPFVKLETYKATPREEPKASITEKPSPTEYGSIQISCVPDAQVFLDGNPMGETPLTLKKIPVGSYVLKLSREGFRDLRQTVYVKSNETTKVSAELKPETQ